jgi:transcriptional regulator with XRE-family HTH domain
MATSTASPLREWRERVGIPLNALARTCGVSWWVLARVEAGEVEPRAAIVARLAEVTGIPFDRLLGARGRARLERFRATAKPEASGKAGRPSNRPWPRPTASDLAAYLAADPDVRAFLDELGRR